MPSNFDGRLVRLERYAPEVNKGQAQSPAPMLMAFVADNGGRIGNESWAQATARLLAMPYNEFLTSLRDRSSGVSP